MGSTLSIRDLRLFFIQSFLTTRHTSRHFASIKNRRARTNYFLNLRVSTECFKAVLDITNKDQRTSRMSRPIKNPPPVQRPSPLIRNIDRHPP